MNLLFLVMIRNILINLKGDINKQRYFFSTS